MSTLQSPFYTSNAYYSPEKGAYLGKLFDFLAALAEIEIPPANMIYTISTIFGTSWLEGFTYKNRRIQSIFIKYPGRDSEEMEANIANLDDILKLDPSLRIEIKTEDKDTNIYLQLLYGLCSSSLIVEALLPITMVYLEND